MDGDVPPAHPTSWRSRDKSYKTVDFRIQRAQGVRDCAARFRPGYWMFVGGRKPEAPLGQKSLDASSNIQRILTPSRSWRDNFRAGNHQRERGQVSIHFNASPESVNMICKLMEAVNHLSILIAVMKYMDDLLEETHIEAKGSNISQVKLTPRVQEHCAVPEESNPLTGKTLGRTTRKERRASPPTTASR